MKLLSAMINFYRETIHEMEPIQKHGKLLGSAIFLILAVCCFCWFVEDLSKDLWHTVKPYFGRYNRK